MKKILSTRQAWLLHGKIKYMLCIAVLLAFAYTVTAQTKSSKEEPRCGFNKDLMVKMNQNVAQNIKALRAAGKLNSLKSLDSKAVAAPVLFRWPLTTNGYRDFPSWHIGNFVDLNPTTNLLLNYNCYSSRTYDGHTGTDISVDPYSWEIKNSGFVRVVAGADGIIVDKHDGENDESCGDNFDVPPLDFLCTTYPNNQGNYIVILHNDGTTASFYMHMKNGSLTGKQEGDAVSAGDYLGTVASAGCSTGPHLHFEVRKGYINDGLGLDDVTGTVVDPFANGACAQGTDTYWIDERPYTDPAVTALETHSSDPEDAYTDQCDKTLNLYYDNSYSAGQTIWFRSKLRDWIDGSTITYSIFRPNGTLWHSFTRTNISNYRSYIPVDQSYAVTAFDNAGTYRYTVSFNGKTYSHYFTIGCQADATLVSAVTGHKGTMVSNTITSTQTITAFSSNYIKYMADGHVTLNPGFFARAGCRFVANTEGCNTSANKSAAAATATAETQSEKIISDNPLQNGVLKVYPNPSTGVFTLQYQNTTAANATVTVRNMYGQVVYSSQTKTNITQLQQTISLTGKPKGVYIVEVNLGIKKLSSKVVIQ